MAANSDTAIIAILKSDATVVSLSGGRIACDGDDEDGGYPFVSIKEISGNEVYSLTGFSGLTMSRYQIDVYALDRATARQLSDLCRAVLVAFKQGTAPDGTIIQAIKCADRRSASLSELKGSDEFIYQRSFDIMIAFQE
jgi:hypothetical protein